MNPKDEPRRGWEERFVRMAERADDALLDEPNPTEWDIDEWRRERVGGEEQQRLPDVERR